MGGRLRALGLIAAAAIAISAPVVFGLASSSTHRRAPQLPPERIAGPGATLSTSLVSARGGRSIVWFGASWCEPCQREAPALERFASWPAGAGRVVGVDWSDALSGAKGFIARNRWTFPNLRDGDGAVGNEYGISNLPTT